MARRQPAGTRSGGQFAPSPAPERPPAAAVQAAAAEFDAAVARSHVGWRPVRRNAWRSPEVPPAAAGPLAGLGRVRLTVSPASEQPGRWLAVADPVRGAFMFVDPPGEECWPDPESAKRALEAVLSGAPEARATEVRRGWQPSQDRWDWDAGEWDGGEWA